MFLRTFMRPLQGFAVATATALILSGCDSESKLEDKVRTDKLPPKVDTPYAAWPSNRKLNSYELGDLLKQDEDAANLIC